MSSYFFIFFASRLFFSLVLVKCSKSGVHTKHCILRELYTSILQVMLDSEIMSWLNVSCRACRDTQISGAARAADRESIGLAPRGPGRPSGP